MDDLIDIQQTLNKWSEGGSRADWEQLASTLAPDAKWESSALGISAEGIEAISAALAGLIAPFAYSIQMNAPAVITVTGDTAMARSVIRESGKYLDRDEAFEALGFYNDRLVRTANGWKFSYKSFELVSLRDFAIQTVSAA